MAQSRDGIVVDTQAHDLLEVLQRDGALSPGAEGGERDSATILADLLAWILAEPRRVERAHRDGVTDARIMRWLNDVERSSPLASQSLWDRLAGESILAEVVRSCRELPVSAELQRALCLVLLDAPTTRPNDRWLNRFAALKAELPDTELRRALIYLARLGADWEARIRVLEGGLPSMRLEWGRLYPQFVTGVPDSEIFLLPTHPLTMLVARSAMWMIAAYTDDDTRNLLAGAAIAWSRSGLGTPALGLAAASALAMPGDDEAMRRLLNLRSRVSHRTMRRRIDEEIDDLAARLGTSPEDAADALVPAHGLDANGRRSWQLGEHAATLSLTPRGTVDREIRKPDGTQRRALPASVRREHAGTWAEITAETKAVRSTVAAQRKRLEDAMVAGRTWTPEVWSVKINGHPVLANLARRLLWRVHLAGDSVTYALPDSTGAWHDSAGAQVAVSSIESISVAHPIDVPDREKDRWQTIVVDRSIVQPFKQLFRETYVVTLGEDAAGFLSPRFTGLPVALRRVYGLVRSRGWSGPLGQMDFDGAGEGWREFPEAGVRCLFTHTVNPNQCVTVESVRFERSTGEGRSRRWERLRLSDVPAIPFSEAMRDIDLVVSTSALDSDAQWQAWEAARRRGEERWSDQLGRYQTSHPELAASRAALIDRLVPVMGLSGVVTIDGHFAMVRGQRFSYRIHLGTGNVHVEPDGRYLCIVPAYDARPIFLPFEDDDTVVSTLLSKIVLLAHDASVKDPAITAQLPSRGEP